MTNALTLLAAADEPTIDFAATAFVLLCSALVLVMTAPGLALFYGGMVRAKSVLNMMMMSFAALGTVGLAWVLSVSYTHLTLPTKRIV